MKAYIIVEDDIEVYQLLNAENAFQALWNIVYDQRWRSMMKHGIADDKIKTPEDALQWVKDMVLDTIEQHGLDLDRGCQ